jgi:hypothetical protein
VAGTYVAEPHTRAAGKTAVEVLTGAGFPAERAAWIVFALWHYVLGHTIEEQAQAEPAPGAWAARLAAQQDDSDTTRILSAAVDAERFAYGVALFIDGVRVRLQQGATMMKVRQPGTRQMIGLTVRENVRISPKFARLTLGGPDVEHLENTGFDQTVRLFFPREGQPELQMPTWSNNAWTAQTLLLPKARRPWVRNYTVRRVRAAEQEIDIEFRAARR